MGQVICGGRVTSNDNSECSSSSTGRPKLQIDDVVSPGANPYDDLGEFRHGDSSYDDDNDEVLFREEDDVFTGHLMLPPMPVRAIRSWTRGKQIGFGTFGKVYEGINLETGEMFVVKQVEKNVSTAKKVEELNQLQAEVELLCELVHPNIVRYLGYEETGGEIPVYSVFLEYMSGGSIADALESFGAFKEGMVSIYALSILQGLHYLHKNNVIHRDLKCQNILLNDQGICKIADFGSSKRLADVENGMMCSLKGTPIFMAPEVILSQSYSVKSDVWAFGCCIVQMLTAAPPYNQFSNHVAAFLHISSLENPPDVPANVSNHCSCFIINCFAYRPELRWDTGMLQRHSFVAHLRKNTSRMSSRKSSKTSTPFLLSERNSPKGFGPKSPFQDAVGGESNSTDVTESNSMAATRQPSFRRYDSAASLRMDTTSPEHSIHSNTVVPPLTTSASLSSLPVTSTQTSPMYKSSKVKSVQLDLLSVGYNDDHNNNNNNYNNSNLTSPISPSLSIPPAIMAATRGFNVAEQQRLLTMLSAANSRDVTRAPSPTLETTRNPSTEP